MRKLIAIIVLLFITGCTEEKEVVAITPQEDGTVELFTETSSKWAGMEVAKFEGSTITDKPSIIINNDDGTVTVYYPNGKEYTAPRR